MSGPELRTYCLSAVLTVLLGAGIGFGWHYFVDSAGARTVASTPAPTAPEAPSPPSPSSPATREGPVSDVSRLSDAQQRARSMALDLSDDEKLALAALLTHTIVHDRYPRSPRVRTLKDVLAKLDAKPPAQPSLAAKVYTPPEETRNRTRHRG